MINQALRDRVMANQRMKSLTQGVKDMVKSSLKEENPNEEVLKLVVKHEEGENTSEVLSKLGQAIAMIYNVVKKPIILPKIFQIFGRVQVENAIKIQNLQDLEKYFKSLEQKLTVWAQAASTAQPPQIKFPKIEIPKSEKVDFSPVIEALSKLEEKLSNQPKTESSVGVLRQIREGIDSLVSRPQLTPNPVTSVSINPLRGVVKTTATTVGTTVTQLPGYGQLLNRRAVIVYNNSANTIYVGGSDVTTSTGFPVASSNFSSPIDASYNTILYGIASQGGNDVRVMEISDEAFPNHPGL